MPIDDATPSHVWDPAAIHDIQEKARLGRYRIRAFSTARRLPSLEDLTFLARRADPRGAGRIPGIVLHEGDAGYALRLQAAGTGDANHN